VLSGLVINAVTGLFLLVYVALAQKRRLIVSLAVAAACWISLGAPLSLAAALAIPLVWNLTLWVVHRRAAFALN
jgi:hypothetical protein